MCARTVTTSSSSLPALSMKAVEDGAPDGCMTRFPFLYRYVHRARWHVVFAAERRHRCFSLTSAVSFNIIPNFSLTSPVKGEYLRVYTGI